MIDYDKLKIVHELAQKYSSKIDSIVQIVLEFNPGCNMYGFRSYYFPNENLFMSIDVLIEKLSELTKPEPKFKVGQIAWFIDCRKNDGPITSKEVIYSEYREVLFGNHKFYVTFEDGLYIAEDFVFATKAELIEAQIAYWLSLKNEESQQEIPGQNNIVCEHESDTYLYDTCQKIMTSFPNHLSYQELLDHGCSNKCKKCGEFYR